MGSFFANVQVRAPRDLVREQLIAHARAGIYEPAQVEADRGCAIATSGDGWTAVYDEDIDVHDLKSIEELAATLSLASAQCAVSILVNDSDELVLSLFEEGKRLDRVRIVPGKRVKFRRVWRAAFPKLPAELPAAEAFAEESLPVIADAMGVSADHFFGSYGHRDELPPPIEELHFALKPEYQFIVWAEGPPEVWAPESEKPRRATTPLGQELLLTDTLYNQGGPCRGLSVMIPAGDWMDLFDATRVQLTLGAKRTTVATAPQFVEKNGARAFVARFEDATLGAWPDEAKATTGWQIRKAQHAYNEARIWSAITVVPKKPGTATMRVIFYPREHLRGGDSADYAVTVMA